MLQVNSLQRRFGETIALDGVSFSVQRGQCFGLLGPNGAGKSTTISIIVGVLRPDSGSVTLEGKPISGPLDPIRRKIGYVPQDIAVYEDLTADRNLRFIGGLYGLQGVSLASGIQRALDTVGLSDRAHEPVRNFSGGMKRRLNIAAALVHDPELLIFDEPTVGVDPQSRNAIFDSLKLLQEQGKTLIYTTHYMEEVERLCDQVAIIDSGRVVANGTLTELYRLLPAANKITVTFSSAEEARAALPAFAQVGSSSGIDQGVHVELQVPDMAKGMIAVAQVISHHDIPFVDIVTKRATLEEVFLHSTGRRLRDA